MGKRARRINPLTDLLPDRARFHPEVVMRKPPLVVPALVLGCLVVPGCIWLEMNTVLDYHAPQVKVDNQLADDRLEDRPAPAFDPDLVDRRPLDDFWQLNASAAVVRLDVPPVKPDVENRLLLLYPSYRAAADAAPGQSDGAEILPSVNLVDGKAKQFDDGLYAALDRAYYRGLQDRLHSHVQLIQRLYQDVGKDSPAAPFLAAGLDLAGVTVAVTDERSRNEYLQAFRADEVASKPVGFYTWNEELATCFRFLRYFQHEFDDRHQDIPRALASALARDEGLRKDYTKVLQFYARLSNPPSCRSLLDLVGTSAGGTSPQLGGMLSGRPRGVAVFPASTSRETVLFEKLFPRGLPENVELMQELIQALRSGKVDLKPTATSGWYEHQVYALETFLLPEKGEEHDKLLLTRAYKKRMLEALEALITKRRETHIRPMSVPLTFMASPSYAKYCAPDVRPRLRVEPCPSYFLRTARAYNFLANFLEAAVGEEGLRSLRGLRQGGEREQDLFTELHGMRDLFYGLYLVSAEDIGLKPTFAPDESVDIERCYHMAVEWLPRAVEDADAAADTRVLVPVYVDPRRRVTRVWATLGVRLARLDADYARPPSVRAHEQAEWQAAKADWLRTSHYLIAVDEFVEVELRGQRMLTREEFRTLCNGKNKEEILDALRK